VKIKEFYVGEEECFSYLRQGISERHFDLDCKQVREQKRIYIEQDVLRN
jgi:hypothetical protein